MTIITALVIFNLGIVVGIIIMRYAYGLGFKAFQQVQKEEPLRETDNPIEQEITGEI